MSPDIARNRYIILRASFAVAAAIGTFVLLYLIQLPFTGFNLLFWFLFNVAIALSLNSALTNNKNGAIISGVILGRSYSSGLAVSLFFPP